MKQPQKTDATLRTKQLQKKEPTVQEKPLQKTDAPLKQTQKIDATPDIPQLVAAGIGALMVGMLYLVLPPTLTLGFNWLVLVATLVLLAPALVIVLMPEHGPTHHLVRKFTLCLLFVLTAALLGSLGLLIHILPTLDKGGLSLLKPAVLLWSCNVLIFAIWYWEMDGDGPIHRRKHHHEAADFQFPQQVGGNDKSWVPGFVDYLFLAFCSATALSPADTMPLTRRAKLLMMAEAMISMLILVLLVSRSINII